MAINAPLFLAENEQAAGAVAAVVCLSETSNFQTGLPREVPSFSFSLSFVFSFAVVHAGGGGGAGTLWCALLPIADRDTYSVFRFLFRLHTHKRYRDTACRCVLRSKRNEPTK